MIPCQVCGKDASLGWVKGFTPSPDSQKMALCAVHDTEDNRRRLLKTWQLFMLRGIQTATRNSALHAMRGGLHLLTVHFTAGGSVSLPCAGVEETDHGSLKAWNLEGGVSFFPLPQIRTYELTPLSPESIAKLDAPPRSL